MYTHMSNIQSRVFRKLIKKIHEIALKITVDHE